MIESTGDESRATKHNSHRGKCVFEVLKGKSVAEFFEKCWEIAAEEVESKPSAPLLMFLFLAVKFEAIASKRAAWLNMSEVEHFKKLIVRENEALASNDAGKVAIPLEDPIFGALKKPRKQILKSLFTVDVLTSFETLYGNLKKGTAFAKTEDKNQDLLNWFTESFQAVSVEGKRENWQVAFRGKPGDGSNDDVGYITLRLKMESRHDGTKKISEKQTADSDDLETLASFKILKSHNAEQSRVLCFNKAREAYSAIISYLQSGESRKVDSATLVQHSGTYSHELIYELLKRQIPTTIYIQSIETILKVLGMYGYTSHYKSQEENQRRDLLAEFKEKADFRYYKPVASLSAVMIEHRDGDSFLLLSSYIYESFASYESSGRLQPRTMGKSTFDQPDGARIHDVWKHNPKLADAIIETIRDPNEVNKIWGHRELSWIFFSNRGKDRGFQLLLNRFQRFINHLELEQRVNPSVEHRDETNQNESQDSEQ
jgi:hypothetical protein